LIPEWALIAHGVSANGTPEANYVSVGVGD
jgi:hypothetical protein